MVALLFLQVADDSSILDAFGNDLQPETMRHFDDQTDDVDIRLVALEPFDERLVDLQFIGRNIPEIGEAGIAGAEIVYGYPDPVISQ